MLLERISLLILLLASFSGSPALAYDLCGTACVNALRHCPDAPCRENVFRALDDCRRTRRLGALTEMGGASDHVIDLRQIPEPSFFDHLWAQFTETEPMSSEERTLRNATPRLRPTYPVPDEAKKRCLKPPSMPAPSSDRKNGRLEKQLPTPDLCSSSAGCTRPAPKPKPRVKASPGR